MTDRQAKKVTSDALDVGSKRIMLIMWDLCTDGAGDYKEWMYSKNRAIIRSCLDHMLALIALRHIRPADIIVSIPESLERPLDLRYGGVWLSAIHQTR